VDLIFRANRECRVMCAKYFFRRSDARTGARALALLVFAAGAGHEPRVVGNCLSWLICVIATVASLYNIPRFFGSALM